MDFSFSVFFFYFAVPTQTCRVCTSGDCKEPVCRMTWRESADSASVGVSDCPRTEVRLEKLHKLSRFMQILLLRDALFPLEAMGVTVMGSVIVMKPVSSRC